MSQTSTHTTSVNNEAMIKRLMQVATWPPLVYFLLGVVCTAIWASGTSVQVLTSEAWIAHGSVTAFLTLSTFGQLWDLARGALPASQIVPVTFGWGVQIALIIASVGIELPRYPKWRYYTSWAVVIGLIGINSGGDYNYSSAYGFWGAAGFTLVILFVTFCVGLLAVMCYIHGFRRLFASAA